MALAFLENFRSSLFWLMDAARGGAVHRHLKDIRQLMTSQDMVWVEKQIEIRLDRLLSHAVKTTPFYSDFDLTKGISVFPVIDKNLIRTKQELFFSNAFRQEQ